MNGYIGNTDQSWFRYLRDRKSREVNFWQPSGGRAFHAVAPGSPFFFKLKRPHNMIGGFGFFTHHSVLPAWLAWETFGEANGAATFTAFASTLEKLRRSAPADRTSTRPIGCLILNECVFFADEHWVRPPNDYAPNIVQGSSYDLTRGEGARIWNECRARAQMSPVVAGASVATDGLATEDLDRYGDPVLVRPRLGQRAFRIAVLDAYGRSCAVSTEHSLPVLEAAHIRRYADHGEHNVRNGICLRADIHRLFDAGYVTVDDDNRLVVSGRLKEEFDNGKRYYADHGRQLHLPGDRRAWPSQESLEWHRTSRFAG